MKKKRILIVDNNISNALSLMEYLTPKFDITICTSAYHVIDQLTHYNAEIVVINYYLPDISGLQLASVIRTMRPTVEVIFMADSCPPDLVIEAFRSGIADFWDLPISKSNLVKSINRIIKEIDGKKIPATSPPKQFTPLEYLITDLSGLPLYHWTAIDLQKSTTKRDIFTGVLSAIQMVLTDELGLNKQESGPMVIQTGKIVTLVDSTSSFSTVLIGVGEPSSEIKFMMKKVTKIIQQSNCISTEKTKLVEDYVIKEKLCQLKGQVPPFFKPFFS